MDLWQCTVLKPMTCHLNGPGVGNPVHEQIVIIIWLGFGHLFRNRW